MVYFDIITSPFRAIFDLISSIFDFDFLGYLETLPGVKQVMGVIRGVAGFFTSDEEEDIRQKAERDEEQETRVAKKSCKRVTERFERAVEGGNVTINGQQATPEQRAELLERAQSSKIRWN